MEQHPQDPNRITSPPAAELAQKLDELVRDYDLDQGLADQYAGNTDDMYQYPGMGVGFQDHLAQLKLRTLTDLQETYEAMYGRSLLDRVIEHAPRETRRKLHSTDFSRRMGGTVLDLTLQTREGSEWAQQVEATENEGLLASDITRALTCANNLQYSRQVGWEEIPLHDDEHDVYFGPMGFNPDTFGPDPTLPGMTAELAERGLIDLSKEVLDARVEKFSAAMQIEAVAYFLDGLQGMSALKAGAPVKQARWLASRYKNVLLLDDYDMKIKMIEEMGNLYQDFERREHHGMSKKLMRAMANWSFTASEQLESFLAGFIDVYEALGYELHPLLRPEEPEAKVRIQPLVEPDQTPTPETAEVPATVSSEFEGEIKKVFDRAAKLNKIWRMNARERRTRGFDTMYHELVGGFKNFAGRRLLERMDKKDAQAYIDIVNHLYELGEGPDAHSTLTTALTEEAAIRGDFTLLQSAARKLGLRISCPDIPPIQAKIAAISQDPQSWDTFRQIALKTWPDQQGLPVIQRLEKLLFSEPQPVEDDQLTQEAISQQLEMAEYLDLIVLPPDATKEDLERELERIGAESISISVFEWQRLEDLVKLREEFGGTLYRTKDRKPKAPLEPVPKPTEPLELQPGQEIKVQTRRQRKKQRAIESDPSFWILHFDFEGDTFDIAESAFTDHASFVVCERLIEGTGLQALGVSRSKAPSQGAHRVVHQGKLPHRLKLQNKVLELHSRVAA